MQLVHFNTSPSKKASACKIVRLQTPKSRALAVVRERLQLLNGLIA